jgi:ribonuclease HIII
MLYKAGNDTYVCELEASKVPILKGYLLQRGYDFSKVPYTHFSASKEKLSVTMYLKGKLVIQGKKAVDFVEFYLEPELLKKITISGGMKVDVDYGESRLGIDESGKGDYFGPMVVAGVYCDGKDIGNLEEMGVKDSKRISDRAVEVLARKIMSKYMYTTVVIGPEKYNELQKKMGNVNTMLAWGHARTIENLLSKVRCTKVVLDQFADQRMVKNALMKKGKEIRLEQRHKAESDLVVAAASIIARAEFLRRLKRLGDEIGVPLPKGASKAVDETGAKILKEKGENILAKIAKLHFKTTQKLKTLNENP